MTDKITDIHSRHFVYDPATQREMTPYNQMLVEMGFTNPLDMDYQPEAYCIISTGNSWVWPSRASWSLDTSDYDALVKLVGHLEIIKSEALAQIRLLDEAEDSE